MASKKRKKKKNNKKNLSKVLLVIVILVVVGFIGYNFYSEKQFYDDFKESIVETDTTIELSEVVTEDVTLAQEIEGYPVEWTSSNEAILSKTGVVNRPTYKEGDKTVILSYTIFYPTRNFLSPYLKDYVGAEDIQKTITILVKAKDPTPQDLINEVLDATTLPVETFQSIGFVIDTCYKQVKLSYTSSVPSVLDNTGKVTTPSSDTDVKVTITGTMEGVVLSRDYSVKVLAKEFEFNTVDNNFNTEDTTRKYSDLEIGGVNYHGAMIVEEEGTSSEPTAEGEVNEFAHLIKLRSNPQENYQCATFETQMLNKPLVFSYDYKFAGSQKTESATFDIYSRTSEKDEYTLLTQKVVHILDIMETISIDLSSYDNIQLKVVFNTTWKSDSFVLIDNVKVTKTISQAELEGSVSLISNFSRSMMLPFTTKYGGSVTWKSSDESKITSCGTLLDGASGKVTLTATIVYNTIHFTQTFEVSIQAKNQATKDNLEIYFIDLGVYGLSDCGECTYIKYNDYDIIVDGGDHFDSTTKAISEVFEAHTNDKVIDLFVATHPDSDHIGGIPYLFEQYQVNMLYKFADETFTTQKFKNMKAAYDSEPNCKVYDIVKDVFQGDKSLATINISSDIYIQFIDTGYLQDKETNGRSVVFELFAYDTVVLMTGDADNGGSHSKLEVSYMNQIGDIDILKVCHHATENGTCSEFLNQVKPEVAVICNGNYLGNKHSHPNKAPLERMNNYSSDLHIYAITGGGVNAEATSTYAYRGSCSLEESLIDRNGTITCLINDAGYTFSCANFDTIKDLRDTQYWKILFK